MTVAVQTGCALATTSLALDRVTDGARIGRIWAQTSAEGGIAALWREAWNRIRAEHDDFEARFASLPSAVSRLEASAARWAARVLRGQADAIEAEAKIADWADAVIAALAVQDHARSRRVCADCGTADARGIVTTGTGRHCRRCLEGV
jgi:hypothetical protein